MQEMPDVTLAAIVDALQLSPAHWEVDVSPPPGALDEPAGDRGRGGPRLGHGPTPLTERLDISLQRLGVLPGSTVHFRRPARAARTRPA